MSKSKRLATLDNLAIVHPNAAGLDIGSREIWACVPPGREAETVKRFNTFTPDLQALTDWVVNCGVDTVAMESTGVYWIPVFEMLEARGLKVYLVNSWHLKHVPGRKSDYLDCQWIQKLHGLGLLNGSFRPDGEMVALRGYLRHRAMLLAHRAPPCLSVKRGKGVTRVSQEARVGRSRKLLCRQHQETWPQEHGHTFFEQPESAPGCIAAALG